MGGRGGAPMRAQQNAPAAPTVPTGVAAEEAAVRGIVDTLSARPIFNARGINQGPIGFASISEVRDQLTALGWSREKQDAVFSRLGRTGKAQFTPQSNQKVMTSKERRDSFSQGNQDKHFINMTGD